MCINISVTGTISDWLYCGMIGQSLNNNSITIENLTSSINSNAVRSFVYGSVIGYSTYTNLTLINATTIGTIASNYSGDIVGYSYSCNSTLANVTTAMTL